MEYPEVDTIYRLVGNGCTDPLHVKMKDGSFCIAKTNNNPMGNLALANEFICLEMAKAFGLPIPPGGIGFVSDSVKLQDGLTLDYNYHGPCYISERINRVTKANEAAILLTKNKNDFIKVLLFDHIIYNKDRNPGNLLVSVTRDDVRFFIIDHTHVFRNQTIWDCHCLEQGMHENDYLSKEILGNNSSTYNNFFCQMDIKKDSLLEESKSIVDTFYNLDLNSIYAMIPTEWKPNVSDLDMLTRYLNYRVTHIDKICDIIDEYSRR